MKKKHAPAFQGIRSGMDVATLLISHYVLSLGGVREAARALGRSPSIVSAAAARLEESLAVTLTSNAGGKLLPTLEGRRVAPSLREAAGLVLDLADLVPADGPVERRAARLSVTLPALLRFAAVARAGSIRGAAASLAVGQPQLTRQLRGLERHLGFTLFERGPTGVAATETGRRAAEIAEGLTGLWSRMADCSDDQFRLNTATTRLGAVPPLGRESRVARILAHLAAAWPGRRPGRPLFITSGVADDLLSGLRDGDHDVVLLDSDAAPADLDSHLLSRSRLTLVGAPEVIAAAGGDLATLLSSRPVATPSRRSGLRQKLIALVDDVLPPASRARVTMVEVDSIPVIANLALEHGYVALMPESAYRAETDGLAGIPVPERHDLRLTLVWRPTPHARAAVDAMAEILGPVGLWPPPVPSAAQEMGIG